MVESNHLMVESNHLTLSQSSELNSGLMKILSNIFGRQLALVENLTAKQKSSRLGSRNTPTSKLDDALSSLWKGP